MQRFFQLEKIIRRAPLGMRFLDLVRGVGVNDGLVVTAWRLGTSGPKQVAFSSPMSGVYGFRALPGFHAFEVGERPASDWCGAPDASPPELVLEELIDGNVPEGVLSAGENGTQANFVIAMEDRMGRFLPEVLLMCLPKEQLVEVPLFSSPARVAPAGLGVVRGQLATHQDVVVKGAASWARIQAILDGHIFDAVADARGMFSVFVPYARALPPLEGTPPHGRERIDQLTWPITFQVFYQPSAQRFVAGLEPPTMGSILEQGGASVYARVGMPLAELTSVIRFGEDLVVSTEGQSELFVDPAPP